jgi:hypothetical protein
VKWSVRAVGLLSYAPPTNDLRGSLRSFYADRVRVLLQTGGDDDTRRKSLGSTELGVTSLSRHRRRLVDPESDNEGLNHLGVNGT